MKNASVALLLSCTLLTISCKREEEDKKAGKGGNGTISCTPEHHGVSKNILNGKVFIKYNAQNQPSSYDDSADCIWTDGKPVATFTGLKTGNYYLAGRGVDTSIKGQTVQGGMPYTLQSETAVQLAVPVTEGD